MTVDKNIIFGIIGAVLSGLFIYWIVCLINKKERFLEKGWIKKRKRECDDSWRANENKTIGAWRKEKIKIRAASWP